MAEENINPIELIVIGGSSGSLEAILKILAALKVDFCIPILLVVHCTNTGDSGLSDLLATRTLIKVKEAEEKEVVEDTTLYVAPTDYHLLVEADKTLSLDVSEKVNYCRPSIDVTFESAAVVYREKLLCIVLSGANADGAGGAAYAKELGATIIIQDPEESLVSYMPQQAILQTSIDHVMSVKEISEYLNGL